MKFHVGWTALSVIGGLALMMTGPAVAQGTGANLIINGGFESGNTGFTTGYVFGNVSAPGTYTIGNNPSSAPGAYPDWCNCADHTTGTGNMMIVNGADSASSPVWEQVVPVTPFTDYTFSYWAAEVDHVSQSVPVLSLRINGTVIGSNSLPKVSPDNGGEWVNYKFTWNSGSSQNADLALFDQNTGGPWNDFALDDICFSTMGCGTAPVLSEDQFLWEGQTYGWYDDGWSGPGCYVVGFASRRGQGFGGGDGWHGCHHGGGHPHGSGCGGPGQPLCGGTTNCGGQGQPACGGTTNCGGPGQPACGPTFVQGTCGGPGQPACSGTTNCGGPGQPACSLGCVPGPGLTCYVQQGCPPGATCFQGGRCPQGVLCFQGGSCPQGEVCNQCSGGTCIEYHTNCGGPGQPACPLYRRPGHGGGHRTPGGGTTGSHAGPTYHATPRRGTSHAGGRRGATHSTSHPTFHASGGGRKKSDIRLKHDIVLLGHLDNGLGFYRFSYNGSDKVYVGVMAQEVRAVMPEAVVRGSDGYLLVDYDRLGIRMQTWNAWVASGQRIPTAATIRH